MSAVDIKFYEKKKSQTFYVAVALIFLVIAITAGLYYYSYTQTKTLQENAAILEQVKESISVIEEDEKVQVYSVYAKNIPLFRKMAEASKIPVMINHLKRVFTIQGVTYKWFSYGEGKAQIELSLETNDSGYAYEKVIKFLKNYRENEEALFTIDQITSFTWYDRMNFTADLILKNQ